MMPEQQQRILGYFIEEAKDHLNTIEQGLLNLQATIQDSEMMNEVFRAAHSVKGGAAMLSLGSIQRTSHRLEDYFKVLKEAPTTQVDRDLESMFLQVFDGLQALLEELQGPFGLTEDKAQEVMTDIEPVFEQLEHHLTSLVANAPAVVAPAAPPTKVAVSTSHSTLRSEDSALKLVFSSDVPGHLREMLTLFKQADSEASRTALQACCEVLKRIGEQFDLEQWIELTIATHLAVGNSEQTYRILAPVVIKELKRAQEQVLSGQAAAITISAELEALIPFTVEVDDSLGDIDSLLDDTLATTGDSNFADLLAVEAQSANLAEAEPLDWLDLPNADAEQDSSDDLTALPEILADPLSDDDPDHLQGIMATTEPAVGTAELNSLADLFEGEVSGLDSPWEEMSEPEAENTDRVNRDIDGVGDLSDLFNQPLGTEGAADPQQDLADLFGDGAALEADLVEQGLAETADGVGQTDSTADFDDLFSITDAGTVAQTESTYDPMEGEDDELDDLLDSISDEADDPADESSDWVDAPVGLETDNTVTATEELDNLAVTSDTAIDEPVLAEAVNADESNQILNLDTVVTGPVEMSLDMAEGLDDARAGSFEEIEDPWSLEVIEEDLDDSALSALDELWNETRTLDSEHQSPLDNADIAAPDVGELSALDTELDVDEVALATDLDGFADLNSEGEPDFSELLNSDIPTQGDFDNLLSEYEEPAANATEPLSEALDNFDLNSLDANDLVFEALLDETAESGADVNAPAIELDDMLLKDEAETTSENFDSRLDLGNIIDASPETGVSATLESDLTWIQSQEFDEITLEASTTNLGGNGEEDVDALLAIEEIAAPEPWVSEEDELVDEAPDFDLTADIDSNESVLNVDTTALNNFLDEAVAPESDGEVDDLTAALAGDRSEESAIEPTDALDSTAGDDFFGIDSVIASSSATGEGDALNFDLESELLTPQETESSDIQELTTPQEVIEEFFETPISADSIIETTVSASPTEDKGPDLVLDKATTTSPATPELLIDDVSLDIDDSASSTEETLLSEANFNLADMSLESSDSETDPFTADLDFDQAVVDLSEVDSSSEASAEILIDESLFQEPLPEDVLEFDLGDLESGDEESLASVEEESISSPMEIDFTQDFSDFNEFDAPLEETPLAEADEVMTLSEVEAPESADLDALDSLLNDETPLVEQGGAAELPEVGAEGADLDALDTFLNDADVSNAIKPIPLEASPETPADVDFGELDALLDDDLNADASSKDSVTHDSTDEFGDLEKLLEEADQTLGGGAPSMRSVSTSRSPRRVGGIVDQTMRVSVKHLDNLNNLVGELVVNRNSLEQDQDRLRQFLDNLLFQVQQLNDVGQRMRDLYERSLLESSLLVSRQAFQSGGVTRSSTERHSGNGGGHATGATFDALEMDRFTGFHTLTQEMVELIVRVRESASDIAYTVESTDQIARQFRQVTTQLQEGLNKARMVPFAQTADRLPRAVRDISIKCGKEARLVVEGRDTLIDKMILERLYDPMTHLVNNAITHGIESPEERAAVGKPREGKITVRAFYQGNQTVIYIADDGMGINPDIVKGKAIQKGLMTQAEADSLSTLETYELLFRHGFSTRDKADDFAGRGVGMDVVRTALSEIRGSITIDSELGKGTSFTIRLPLTLSISKALSCLNNQARIAFPMDGVEDMFDVPRERIQTDENNHSYIQWRDTMLTFQPLSELLQFNRALGRGRVYGGSQDDDMISIVVLRNANTYIGIQVDRVLGEQEIVIKQIEGPVPKPMGIAGATVLGDGRVMPIGDVLELMDIAQGRVRREAGSSLWSQVDLPPEEDVVEAKAEPTVLIVDDSITVRELLSMSFNKVGYRVEQARDGQEAWEKMRSGLPCDLVFCDIEMPRMDGLELLSRMQKDSILKQVPIAMLTSRGADRHRQMAVDLGASGYFTKPYLEEALLDAAQRMLNGEVLLHQLHDEAEQ